MAFTVDIRGNASHLEKTLKQARSGLNNLADSAKLGVTALAGLGAAGAASIGAFVISSSKAAADIEDLSIQFEVLTGSAKTSADLLKAFKEEEKKSALDVSDYANAAQSILSFGGAVEDIVPTLRMIGDISMGNSDKFAGLSLAFAQVTASGRLMGTEVLQFVNAGFNPLEQIARDTGRAMGDLKKDMEDGKISVQMVKEAFISATSEGGRFYKAIDKGSAGTNAKINQTKAAVTSLQVAFGTGFNVGLKDALDATNTFLPQIEEKFATAGSVLGGALSKAVQGNTEELAAIGGFMGEIVFAGFKAVYLKGMDELVAATQNKATVDPTGFKTFSNKLAERVGMAPQYDMSPKFESAPLSAYMQTAIEEAGQSNNLRTLKNADIQRQITEGLKTGVQRYMSDEVRKGVLEGMKYQPGGSRFTN